jgi:4-alpha-glucanotransferase
MRRFWQFLFWRQWEALRAHARARGVRVFGDVPIYVAHDSADVWAHPEMFELDGAGRPLRVSGVPPDYFSETGQRWGNPLYRWDRLREDGFAWWVRRLAHTLRQVDVVRLDHFRGFEAYWAIPADEETAVNGEWVEAPGRALFEAFTEAFGKPLPLVAEDLGLITPEVTRLKDRFRLPGMAVLPFGFSGDPESEHLPHNYAPRTVAYTGTHDNDTFVGWLDSAPRADRRFARAYLGLGRSRKDAHWAAIRAVMASAAETAVVPLQDVLGLGSEARMNTPGSESGNWGWRVAEGALSEEVGERLREATHLYGRLALP